MSTPDETLLEEAFAEFAHAAELMVDPVDSAVIHGRVRRRRTTKGALAAALAALIVAVPAVWWLQESNGQEVDPRPAETSSEESSEDATPPAEGGTGTGEVPQGQETDVEDPALPTFGDLVGAEIELPEFFPGQGSLNDACPVAPAVLGNGVPDWDEGRTYPTGGPVWVLKVVHTPMEEGGPSEAVALLGCRPGEAMVRQAVTVETDGEGGWRVGEQVALGDPSDFAVWDVAPAASSGVLVMATDNETTGVYDPVPVDYRILRYRTGEDPVDVTDDAYLFGVTDLAVTARVVELEGGHRELEIEVENAGDHESAPFQILTCTTSEHFGLLDHDAVDCPDGYLSLGEFPSLAVGETATETVTLDLAPESDWTADELETGLNASVRAVPKPYGAEILVYDPDLSNNSGQVAVMPSDSEAAG